MTRRYEDIQDSTPDGVAPRSSSLVYGLFKFAADGCSRDDRSTFHERSQYRSSGERNPSAIVLRVPFDRRERTLVRRSFTAVPRGQPGAGDAEFFRLAKLLRA